MKRFGLIVVLALVALAATSFAQTVDELVEKNFEAKGGRELLQSIKTMKSFGKYSMMGMDFPFTVYNKRPDKFRLEASFQGMTMVQATDGTTAWTISPFSGETEPREMSRLEALSVETQSDMDGLLGDYKEKGWELTLAGKEDMEGTEVYHLNLKISDTINVDIYLDAEYYLEVKTTSNVSYEGKEIVSEIFLSDYKEVDGMMVPFSMEVHQGPQQASTIVIDSLQTNVEIPDDIFVMPEPKAEEPAKKDGE